MMKADIQQTSDSCHHILNRSRKYPVPSRDPA